MKAGDKVRVTKLIHCDVTDTNLKAGAIGVITEVTDIVAGFEDDFVFEVDFGENFKNANSVNYSSDGYCMYAFQLEKVKEDKP